MVDQALAFKFQLNPSPDSFLWLFSYQERNKYYYQPISQYSLMQIANFLIITQNASHV